MMNPLLPNGTRGLSRLIITLAGYHDEAKVTGLPGRTSHAVGLHEDLLQVLPNWQRQGVLRSRF